MNNLIRLKEYRTFMDDGKSSVTIRHANKKRVFLALIVGDEPARLDSVSECADVDSVILALAEIIKTNRKHEKKSSAAK